MSTIEVRAGDEIPIDSLYDWLSARDAVRFPRDATFDITQYPAGFSNLTYQLRVQHNGVESRYVLRRPPRGAKSGNAHDMAREHGVLKALHPVGIPVPEPVVLCNDPEVIGAPFYIMEHVDGVILRGRGSDGELNTDTMARLSETFVETLSALHAVDVERAGLSTLGHPEGYVQRQVEGWSKRWRNSRTDDVPTMDRVSSWLAENRPAESGATLVHNDFKFDNLVLASDLSRVVAILDWEMATIGDPLMDLGTSLAYWVEATDPPVFRALGLGITSLPGNATRAELVRAYAERTRRDVSDAPFYYAFGLFKVAVIAQQIYARHMQGLTSDPRFGALGDAVRAMGAAALDVTERGAI